MVCVPSGNIRQPKYGHLKDLHKVIKSIEKILVHGEYNDTSYGQNITVPFTSRTGILFLSVKRIDYLVENFLMAARV